MIAEDHTVIGSAGRLLDGRHAWVTGAGRGIGRAVALALGGLGATLHLVSRTESELEAVARESRAAGAKATVHPLDICETSAVEALMRDARVDILVNVAGINVPTSFDAVTQDTYDRVMAVNVRALVFITQVAVRRMRAGGRGGSVVNITSQMAHVGGPDRTVYCASKAAVEGLTRALAVELAPEGIRVNSVAPTFIETALTAPFLAEPRFRDWALAQLPLGRFGTPEEVAAAVAFLAGPQASLITGTSLLADGGWTAR